MKTQFLMALLLTLNVGAAELTVRNGESIQAQVNAAQPGDTVLVYPGSYRETVYIDKDNITLRGVIEEGRWPTLDGNRQLNDAVLYSGNGITVENLKIVHFKGNAIMGQAGNNFVIQNNWIIDTGVYGIFPQYGTNGLIQSNVLSGIEDAAIYVGMCDNVDVIGNEVFENVAGIEIENTRNALVEHNYVHNNTGGILVFITPGLPIKTARNVIVRNNFVGNNNTPNFGAPGSIVSGIPAGTGILIMAADDVTIENNIVSGNNNAGITAVDLSFAANVAADPESEPNPDRLAVMHNFMVNNGASPTMETKALLALMGKATDTGPDIVALGGAMDSDNCILEAAAYRTVGLQQWHRCTAENALSASTYRLPEPVPPRSTEGQEKVERVYNGVCAGCHAFRVTVVGPPTETVQALYQNNPKGIADYIANPEKRRPEYPPMPSQAHLDAALRLEVARYMLAIEN